MKIRKVLETRFVQFCCFFVLGLIGLLFACLNIAGILQSSIMDPDNFVHEHVLFVSDNVPVNIISCVVFFLLFLMFFKLIKQISIKRACIVLMIFVTIIGMVWVLAVNCVPMADSGFITEAALKFVRGDYTPLTEAESYFRYYPFQLGFTFICEMVFTCLGSESYALLWLLNILFLDIAYLALIKVSRLIFQDEDVVKLTILLLAGCLQPVLFCTYIYGNIMGLALALWAVVFEIEFITTRQNKKLLFAVLLIAFSITVKLNYSIVLIAMCIMLFIDFIKNHKMINLMAILCAAVLSVGLLQLIIAGYELRAGVNLGKGMPNIMWASMGMQESPRAPGWYSNYTVKLFKDSGFDPDVASAQAKSDMAERITYFSSHPGYAISFFKSKILSQWNEPAYQSIWISQTKKHFTSVPGFVNSVYKGILGNVLAFYFNIFQQLILIGFLVAIIKYFRKQDINFIFLPVIILGGFFYHLLFEAKSQYILTYFVMLVPYAAFGIYTIMQKLPFNRDKEI